MIAGRFSHEGLRQLRTKLCCLQFCAACRTSVNFRLLSVWLVILPSTFCADWRPSVNFRQLSVASRPVNFRQLYVRPENLSSSSIRLLCGWEIFRNFPSTFFAAGRPFVPFRQLSMRPEVLPSTFHVAKRISCEVPSPFLLKSSINLCATGCTKFHKSRYKVFWRHGNLAEVDREYSGLTES